MARIVASELSAFRAASGTFIPLIHHATVHPSQRRSAHDKPSPPRRPLSSNRFRGSPGPGRSLLRFLRPPVTMESPRRRPDGRAARIASGPMTPSPDARASSTPFSNTKPTAGPTTPSASGSSRGRKRMRKMNGSAISPTAICSSGPPCGNGPKRCTDWRTRFTAFAASLPSAISNSISAPTMTSLSSGVAVHSKPSPSDT